MQAILRALGVLIRFADHKNFSDIGQGLWWAVQTVTTVGYGDLVLNQAQDGGRWASKARKARYFRGLSPEAGWPVSV